MDEEEVPPGDGIDFHVVRLGGSRTRETLNSQGVLPESFAEERENFGPNTSRRVLRSRRLPSVWS